MRWPRSDAWVAGQAAGPGRGTARPGRTVDAPERGVAGCREVTAAPGSDRAARGRVAAARRRSAAGSSPLLGGGGAGAGGVRDAAAAPSALAQPAWTACRRGRDSGGARAAGSCRSAGGTGGAAGAASRAEGARRPTAARTARAGGDLVGASCALLGADPLLPARAQTVTDRG